MENDDNILQRISEMLGSSSGNFSILEHQVDVKVQMEYFEFSKSHPKDDDIEKVILSEQTLYAEDVAIEDKKGLLVSLASIDKPEAYRVIERFTPSAPNELKEWSLMALQESRMLLETRLLDEQQVYISTGLGGKAGSLRYFVVFFSTSNQEFTTTQKVLIKSEFELALRRFNSEVEELNFNSNYASMVALVPLSVHVKQPFQTAIDECNSLGEFIQEGFLITNVKVLNEDEIEDLIKNPPKKYLDEE